MSTEIDHAQRSDQEAEVPPTTLWDALFQERRLKVFYQDPSLRSQVYTLSDAEEGPRHRVSSLPSRPEYQRPPRPPRPKHLRPDNQSSMARLGEHHGRARLSGQRVEAIRAWAAPFLAAGQIPQWTAKAKEENVSEGTLRDIVFRRTWTHL